ncbi:MAG: ABC transporter ATP-binding protein [Deltaproteobacteria bacterium]|nr:ABC transporter ATP-binding protein [Candidatus Anaeroferrophillus wilburensis]MBN2889379.1 ABC transporter ATP-binding protein [Deltaproteobacteria bacterium]
MPGCNDSSGAAAGHFVQVEDAVKEFGGLIAVDQARFSVARGETIGILGSGGAGKTTLLRMIATMLKPTAGRILIDGHDSVLARSQVKQRIGYMPQRFGLYQDLTVEENFDFFMDIFAIRGAERRRRKERYLGFSHLLPFLNRPAGALSGGMKQKLGLACVLVHQPELLILDEPTNGVDPVSRGEFWEILTQMKADGMTILVATAYMDEGQRCDRLILMHAGKVLDILPPAALMVQGGSLEEAMIQRIEAADPRLAEGSFAG